MANSGSFVQFRLDLLDPRHGQPGGGALDIPRHEDGSVDEGRAWARALGGAQDAEMRLLRMAALSRLPKFCPADGLDRLGSIFGLPRFPSEPDETYRARLENAFPTYILAGSAAAIVASLQAYGFVDVLCLPVWQSPAPFLPETSATSYSEFYVFIGPDFGTLVTAPLFLGATTYGTPPVLYTWILGDSASVLGSSLTSDQLVAVKRQILRWKAAHGYPIKVTLLFTGDAVGDAGLTEYPIGRTLGSTLPALGSAQCILGGYQL